MDTILFGFYSDISRYNMREIYQYLLVFSLLLLIAGKYLEKRRIAGDFFRLVRFGRRAAWWRCLAGRVVALSVWEVAAVFLAAGGWSLAVDGGSVAAGIRGIGGEVLVRDTGLAFALWCVGLTAMNLFQMLLINSGRGSRLCFMLAMATEIVSLCCAPAPGSLLMLRRSAVLSPGGFAIAPAVVGALAADGAVVLYGYRFLRLGRPRV